jgi:hypothetical protein
VGKCSVYQVGIFELLGKLKYQCIDPTVGQPEHR